MIPAILSIVLSSGVPVFSQEARVEPAMCRMRAYKGEISMNGTWTPVTVRIACRR